MTHNSCFTISFIIGHININAIRNKFESLVKYVGNNLDILLVSQTKIDDTFPETQFLKEGFSTTYRLDRTAKGGEILLYIRQNIPSKYLKKNTLNESFEGFFVDLNLRSKKWLLRWSYNPHKKMTFHLSNLSTALDTLSTDYENIILLGDFNVKVEERNMSEFMSVYSLRNLVKQKTYFKNPKNLSCIDLIRTNSPRSFQNSNVFETGLSDFHKLATTVLKQYFSKLKPKVVNYRNYRKFHNDELEPNLTTSYQNMI